MFVAYICRYLSMCVDRSSLLIYIYINVYDCFVFTMLHFLHFPMQSLVVITKLKITNNKINNCSMNWFNVVICSVCICLYVCLCLFTWNIAALLIFDEFEFDVENQLKQSWNLIEKLIWNMKMKMKINKSKTKNKTKKDLLLESLNVGETNIWSQSWTRNIYFSKSWQVNNQPIMRHYGSNRFRYAGLKINISQSGIRNIYL
jgi:hypothetical protein